MNSEARDAVLAALASFAQAKAAMEETFRVRSAAEVVSAVLRGRMPREGHCLNGLEYFVHGIGYTVVTASGGQVHFDSGDEVSTDVFSVHDIRAFLETSGYEYVPTIEDVRDALSQLELLGKVRRYGRRFAILRIDS